MNRVAIVRVRVVHDDDYDVCLLSCCPLSTVVVLLQHDRTLFAAPHEASSVIARVDEAVPHSPLFDVGIGPIFLSYYYY